MSFLIAAAGTGGHVFPGLAVAEALLDLGVAREEIVFVGGDRLEASVYPDHGFVFVQVEMRGLKRSLTPSNLSLPRVVLRARDRVVVELEEREVKVVLGMGGYVTIPVALAARSEKRQLFLSEQNANAGLANRIAARWATRVFVSFPETSGISNGEWVGNPVRRQIAGFNRDALRPEALAHFGLEPGIPTVGVVGGSLGAASINNVIAAMVATWTGPPIQILHLVGKDHVDKFEDVTTSEAVTWVRRGFEDRMDLFFAMSDLVVSRAGGAVAEITATGTPSILIPGDFGSSGHQLANASYLESEGAALVIGPEQLNALASAIMQCVGDDEKLQSMAAASIRISRPDAAKAIAQAMIEAAW